MERDEKMIHQEFDLKRELAQQAGSQKSVKDEVKLTKNMTIPDMVKVMMPEIKKALPTVLTPERFTRIALSALNNTPALQKCTPMSFLAALMNAAQLGLEPNTPLGQAYLIPYKNKSVLECQFQIGYKGLIDLAYRNGQMQTIQAQAVYENDEFSYEYGLEPKLFHRPAFSDRGELVYFYGIFRTVNGGYGMAVMSKADMDIYAKTYEKDKDIQELTQYIAGEGTNKEKEEVFYIGSKGLDQEHDKAAKQIIKMQRALKKNNGRRMYHMIISFNTSTKNLLKVKAVSKAVAKVIYEEGYLVYYGIHTSTDNLHIHFAIDSVNYLSGKKWHKSRSEFMSFRNKVLDCSCSVLASRNFLGSDEYSARN